MIERWINDIVNYQIHNKRISVSDREIYQYGYYILFEKIVAVILTICIAALMDAWWEIMGFCISFIPLRVYSGGIHAKRYVNCMLLSSGLLVGVVFLVRESISIHIDEQLYMVALEFIMFIALLALSPVETQTRKIEKKENKYFRIMVCRIYVIQIFIEIFFLLFKLKKILIAFIIAHGISLLNVLMEILRKKLKNGYT